MKLAFGCCLLFSLAAIAPAQQATDPGVASEWDVQKLLDGLDLQTQHLQPVIDQVHPEVWQSKGASPTYAVQWKAAQSELKYLLSSSQAFAKQPERLTLGLDAYFRMQALDSTLGSLTEGIRKYQNPALADLLQAVIVENSTNRDHLRQYLQDLATQKEQEFQIADREAQRCRAALFQQTSPKTKKVAR